MKFSYSESYEEAFQNQDRFLLLKGGGGSGKSEFVGRKIIARCMLEGNHKVLILRKINRTCPNSVVAVILEILRNNKILFNQNKTDNKISFITAEGKPNVIFFSGINDPEKIKSIKGITMVWLEELTEFTEADFNQINLRLRGKTKYYKQIIASFNPDEAVGYWIKQKFYDHNYPNTYKLTTTVDDNPYIDEEYIEQLDNLISDPTLYSIYRKGEWAAMRGLIYPTIHIIPFTEFPTNYDSEVYGLDFGFNHPSVLIEAKIKDEKNLYLRTLLYKKGLTNTDLVAEFDKLLIDKKKLMYADCAEPDKILDLQRAGYNTEKAYKSPGSVKPGIDYCKQFNIFIGDDDDRLISELRIYKWKEDKNGEPMDEPYKFKDDAMDAFRYGVYTNYKKSMNSGFMLTSNKDWIGEY